MAINTTAAAATVGSVFSRMPFHMRRGSVMAPDPDMNSATMSWSNDVMKANRAPTRTPGPSGGY